MCARALLLRSTLLPHKADSVTKLYMPIQYSKDESNNNKFNDTYKAYAYGVSNNLACGDRWPCLL